MTNNKISEFFELRRKLIKAFLIRFFDIKELAYATFVYEISCKHKSPKRKELVVLSRISRNAKVEDIKEKLFTLTPIDGDCKFTIVDVKIRPAYVKEV